MVTIRRPGCWLTAPGRELIIRWRVTGTAIPALAARLSKAPPKARRPTVQQLADAAAFVASDRCSGITASIVNINSGLSAH